MDYTVEGEDADVVQSPDQISVISAPVAKPEEVKPEEQAAAQAQTQAVAQAQAPPIPRQDTLGYCFAMYEYDAEAPDELNLEEGQVRNIIQIKAFSIPFQIVVQRNSLVLL